MNHRVDAVSPKMDQIAVAENVTCLEVVIECELTFTTHVLKLSSRYFYQLRQRRTVRHSLNEEAAKTLVHAFVVIRLDYCSSVLSGITKILSDKLQSVCSFGLQTEKVRPHNLDTPRCLHLRSTARGDIVVGLHREQTPRFQAGQRSFAVNGYQSSGTGFRHLCARRSLNCFCLELKRFLP